MPTFTILSGVPASGKSTFASGYRDAFPDAEVISSDARVEEIAREEGTSYQEAYVAHKERVKEEIRETARKAFAQKRDVLWDQTNLTPEARSELLALVPEAYKVVAVAFEASEALLQERLTERAERTGKHIPAEAIAMMQAAYIRPSVDEGFHVVKLMRAGPDHG